MVPHLNSHIAQITSDLKSSDAPERVAELAETAALVPALKAEIDQHVSAHIQKDQQIGALLSRLEELQPQASNYADLQYEHGLTARKLHMAENAIAAHQAEITNLNQQMLFTQRAEQQPAAQAVSAAKTMAAAAGAGSSTPTLSNFYDVNEGNTFEPAPVPDHEADFEKRIAGLRSIEAAKDVEIANLRARIAEIETTPDPDVKRQILFTAKNAEVTHLKSVLNTLLQPVDKEDIALRAFNYAKERAFSGGSENEDWLRAERDIHYSRLAEAWESTRGGGTLY
jgi:myosin heavy subunit